MYRLTYEDYILYDPRLATPEDRLIIRDPKVHLAVDKAGEMSFLLQPEHPYVDKLRKMSGVVELTDGATPIYRGRITRDTIDFYGVHTVETEGLKAIVDIYSSTSAIAGWSIVALLRNLSNPVSFF